MAKLEQLARAQRCPSRHRARRRLPGRVAAREQRVWVVVRGALVPVRQVLRQVEESPTTWQRDVLGNKRGQPGARGAQGRAS